MADANDTRHPADIEMERQLLQKRNEAVKGQQKPDRFIGDVAGAPTSFPE